MAVTHYHNAYELYCLFHGEREYFIGDSFYKIKERDVVLIPTDVLHRTAGKTSARMLVYFNWELLSRYVKPELLSVLKLGKPLVFRAGDDVAPMLLHDFESLNSVYSLLSEGAGSEASFAGLLFKILFTISHERNHYENLEYTDVRMEKIIRYVNENYATVTGLEELASHFFISKYHFCRMFRKNLGVSVTAYLNTIRVRAATKLLMEGTLSLTDIATKCGFNSVSYFCKVFKSELGVSPSLYRKKTT